VAYHFQRGDPVPKDIRRIAREQLQGAIDSLGRKGKRDEAIHDARKRIKKTRALLRLVKPELGEFYIAENTRLRDAGRALSEFRDAAAIIETLDQLHEKYRDELAKSTLDSVRRALLLHKARTERKAGMNETLREISSTLAQSARRVDRWPLSTDGFPAIGPGLVQTFRRGRKAMAIAARHPRPEHFHEWRKRVKDHWYHIRLLEDVWSDVMGGFANSLKQLEDWLGTDHNLEVLRGKVAGEATLLHLIDRYQKELRECALETGQRIYLERPAPFGRRIERLWDAWQS
jgi:CHAD domain-containing protein